MKPVLLAAALSGVTFTASAFATSIQSVPSQLQSPNGAASQPKPIVVVEPTHLPRSFSGGTITVEFTLDATGRPQDIRLPSVFDPQLNRQVVHAFSQWQFAPGAQDATTQNKRFVLPLEIRPQR